MKTNRKFWVTLFNKINNAGGFWAFAALVVVIIDVFRKTTLWNPSISIVRNITLYLSQPISFPIYLFIASIVLVLIVFIKYANWDLLLRRTKKYDLELLSDELTFFLRSITYPNIPQNKNCFVFNNNHYWEDYALDYEQLRGSFWISDRELIDNIEAENGGYYILERKFEIKHSSEKIKTAIIYFIVDDECTLILNGKVIGNFSSYSLLHSHDLKSEIVNGVNNLTFEIKNNENKELKDPKLPHYYNEQKKGKLNPYGIRYKLTIKI